MNEKRFQMTMPDLNGTFDKEFANQTITNSHATVSYRWESVSSINVGPAVRLIRTVTSNAYYVKDRVILWEQVAAVFPNSELPAHIKDLTFAALDAAAISHRS